MFQFKQFAVDQANCAMKINTDGVLLGAMANGNSPKAILDIGTGTGVIALMLAQRFNKAVINAVEIDQLAAETAKNNFRNSSFANSLTVYANGFQLFFEEHSGKKFDLIVSNPPFYINSLESDKAKINLAKHADKNFFNELILAVANHLTYDGLFWVVLPLQTAELVRSLATLNNLYLQETIKIYSFPASEPHREILVFGLQFKKQTEENFIIYDGVNKYSAAYQNLLKEFFTIF